MTEHSVKYVAGYVQKKLTRRDDPRLEGRPPEFALMSLRPGIGALAVSDIASTALFCDAVDVPAVLRTNGKIQPLGRYLRKKLREETGIEKINEPGVYPKESEHSLRRLRQAAEEDEGPASTYKRVYGASVENYVRTYKRKGQL